VTGSTPPRLCRPVDVDQELRGDRGHDRAASRRGVGEAWPIEAHPGQTWVVVDLWTREEGMSDLSLEATVTESSGEVTVVIHNIHVL